MLPQYDPSYKKTAVWLPGTGSLEALCPEPVVCFKKEVTTEGGTFRIHALGNISVIVGAEPWNQKKYGGQREIKLEPGTTTVLIRVANTELSPVSMWMVSSRVTTPGFVMT